MMRVLSTSTFIHLLFFSLALALDPSDGTCPAPQLQEHVSGFAVFKTRPEDATAFFQDLRPLIASTRNEPGNIHYSMYTNPTAPGVIGFTERYANFDALQSHLQAEHVTSIFQHEYYQTIRSESPQLLGPWKEVTPEQCEKDDEEIEMVFYWNMNCTRKHIWDIMLKWDDASWVKDVVKTRIVPLKPDGSVMSDEEAEAHGEVDMERGLGPVVQRRTFKNGFNLDVRMLERNDTSFVTVQETVTPLVFPGVKFDKFYVTISLLTDGVDEQIQTRTRYHVRATLLEGTNQLARETLKNDFYGPRIDFYQQYFNCSTAVNMKTAQNGVVNLHNSLTAKNERVEQVTDLFVNKNDANDYLIATFGEDSLPDDATVMVFTPVKPVVVPDLRVMSVEDVVIHSFGGSTISNRIVLYQMDAWGRVVHATVFDTPVSSCDDDAEEMREAGKLKSWWSKALNVLSKKKCIGKKFIAATNRYFNVLKTRDLAQIRELYADKHELYDPVGFQPRREYDSVYGNFISLLESFEYIRYPARTFVNVKTRQTIQLIDAKFKGATKEMGEFKAHPIQVLTFDNEMKIEKFEAYFVPRVLDFSKLD